MHVGPLGHQYYGPTVPDVYIYGGAITGKDMSFWGISFAVAFQLVFMLVFSLLSILAFFMKKRVSIVIILFLQLILLALFPVWLKIYIGGVMNNSDAADLTVHYQYGMMLYYTLIGTTVLAVILAFRSKEWK